jgi:glycosyltransferase involved in cell wall biosynthesis
VARSLARRLHPLPRLRVVHNGIDLARLDVAPSREELAAARAALGDVQGRRVVVVVSRRKDQHVLLRALSSVEQPVLLGLVGIEPDATLERLTAALPARHRVAFVPFTASAPAFCALASVAALPSRIEGLSQSLMEAMALGLPVLASEAGGNAELVRHGETGLLAHPLDPASWARELESLLADGGLAARLAAAGRDLVRREFTIQRTAELTETVYAEAIAHRAARRAGRQR